MKKSILAIAAMCTAISAPAFAADAITVEFKDLNLATAEGQAQLDRRLDKAARMVCGLDERTTGTRIRSQESTECLVKAREHVARQVAGLMTEHQRGG